MNTFRVLLICFMLLSSIFSLQAQDDAYLYTGPQVKQLADIKKTKTLSCIESNPTLVTELSKPGILAFFLPEGQVNVRGTVSWHVFLPQKERPNAFVLQVEKKVFDCLQAFARNPQGDVYKKTVQVREAQDRGDGVAANGLTNDLLLTIDGLPANSQAREEAEQIVGAVIGHDTKLIAPDSAKRLNQYSEDYRRYILGEAVKAMALKPSSMGREKVVTFGGRSLEAWDLTELSFQSSSSFFKADEFQNLKTLSAAVKKSDDRSNVLKGLFSAATLQQVVRYPAQSTPLPQLQEDVAKDLNEVLMKSDLITRFSSMSLLARQILEAAHANPQAGVSADDLVYANRLVLEETFPDVIPKDIKGNRPFIINGVPYAKAWKGSTLILFRLERPDLFHPEDGLQDAIKTFLANQPRACADKSTTSPKCSVTAIP